MSHSHSVTLRSPSSPATSNFGDFLFSLGFKPASSEKYEWLSSYPAARPLLNAIESSFSSDCVLSDDELVQYDLNKETYGNLSNDELLSLSRPIHEGNAQVLTLDKQDSQIEVCLERLKYLTMQRDLLQEAVQDKRMRESSPATPVAQGSRLTRGCADAQTLSQRVSELKTIMLREPIDESLDPSVWTYCEKEHSFFEELPMYGRQSMEGNDADAEDSNDILSHDLTTAHYVKGYGEVKGDQYIHEARSIRANSILASLNVNQGSYLEMTIASLRSLIKDIRAKASNTLESKRKEVAEVARDKLWKQVDEISFSETLRQQEKLMELAEFFAKACLEQRARVLCFSMATSAQAAHFHVLKDTTTRLLQNDWIMGSVSASPSDNSFSADRLTVVPAQNADAAILPNQFRNLSDFSKLASSETENFKYECVTFNSCMQALSNIMTDFKFRVGGEGSVLLLEPHPEYAPLVREVEDMLTQNSAILEAVLRRKASQKKSREDNLAWARALNAALAKEHREQSAAT